MADSNSIPERTRSKAVSTLAVFNLVLGGIRLVLSVLAVWLLFNLLFDGLGPDPDVLRVIGFVELVFLWPILLIFALVSILAGILLIIAGMGLWQRRPSSRTLTLVLGSLGGVLAALYGNNLVGEITDGLPTYEGAAISVFGLLVHGSYCIFVFVVLLSAKNAAEFR
jgi:hypothetical protein